MGPAQPGRGFHWWVNILRSDPEIMRILAESHPNRTECDPRYARRVLELCRREGIAVPGEDEGDNP